MVSVVWMTLQIIHDIIGRAGFQSLNCALVVIIYHPPAFTVPRCYVVWCVLCSAIIITKSLVCPGEMM